LFGCSVRWQGRHSLARQQHRHGGYLAGERTALSQSGSLGTVSSNWIIAETGERDPWRDNNTGVAAIWFLDGLQIASSASLGTVDLIDWVIQGTSTDDAGRRARASLRPLDSGCLLDSMTERANLGGEYGCVGSENR
jgi:hypothetical protein